MCSKDKKVEEPARDPAVSGSFYPSNSAELSTAINSYLQNATEFKHQDINAIVVPHAGYIFSAPVAATSYKTLHKEYKNIFLIGSSHHLNFNGISLYDKGDYKTPLGTVKVNKTIVKELQKNPLITYREEAHKKEHTLEVQLPFLQHIYQDGLHIVPIIVASSEIETIKSLASSLRPFFNDDNLFIISSDLSHYPSYDDATKLDMNVLNAMSKNNPSIFLNAIKKNEDSQVENLQTSACGWSSLLTLLYLTQGSDYKYEILEYKNSGDSKYGEQDKVVGYGAMRVYKESKIFTLSEKEKSELKELAKLALYEAVTHNKRAEIDPDKLSPKLKEKLGAFVTLHLEKKLKGCIGRFEPDKPLYDVVIDMAIAASRHDTRFTPLKADELHYTDIKLSILTPRVRVSSIDDIEIGRDGIYVKFGERNGTYLPHVATEMNWSKEEFFRSCCQDKAGIDPKNCKDAQIYTYEAIVF